MPARRVLGPPVEAFDEGQEISELGAIRGVDEHLVGHARMGHAQGQRRVEVAGVEEQQPVLVAHGSAIVPGLVFRPGVFPRTLGPRHSRTQEEEPTT